VEGFLEGFAKADEEVAAELTDLEVASFAQRYEKVLDMLSKRKDVVEGKRVVSKVAPSSARADFHNSCLAQKVPAVTGAVNSLLIMPVTTCSVERNWSRWGLTFAPNRNRLGLESAQKLIFVQQNVQATRTYCQG
jgi:hypothetical protein